MKSSKLPNERKLTEAELRTIAYIATLILAGFLINKNVESAAAWGFLGVAIGALFGEFTRRKKENKY